MSERHPQPSLQWGRKDPRAVAGGPLAGRLLRLVDAGLIATICAAPFVFGGRHDLGRFVFVACVAVTAIAWFARQALLPQARWTRTAAHFILLAAAALLGFQLFPLPWDWLTQLAPRTAQLLPLWSPAADAPVLGVWTTLSLTPNDTTLALAMLVAYGLLFVVVIQRLADVDDVRRVLSWVALAAALMAAFGVLQFATSNGRFFWFYEHPYRTTGYVATGSFMNRNHFASFLVLGVGPLVAWLVAMLRENGTPAKRRPGSPWSPSLPMIALGAALTLVLLGVALSLSRGGAMALVAALTVVSVIYWRWRLIDSKYLFGLAGLALVMLGFLSVYGYDQLAKRLDDFTEGSLEAIDRDAGRRAIWAANVAAIRSGGLFGAGAGSHLQIAPVYLATSSNQFYTHAENGYLQIATETGVLGACLLAASLVLVGAWCVDCWRRLRDPRSQLCFGAAAAGLAASAVHSLVDFVWYIPATMSVTLVLAACVLRLAQLASADVQGATRQPVLPRARWVELATAVTLAAVWTVSTYFPPAMAAIHWDRYLRSDVANSRLAKQEWTMRAAGAEPADDSLKAVLTESMLRHLRATLRWAPNFATAHFELAQRCVDQFELQQHHAANALGLAQIADAAAASHFASSAELHAWLERALGENAALLVEAHDHAQRAVALSPLMGEAYVLASHLSFLDAPPRPSIEQYAQQGIRVRPRNAAVLFELGRQRLVTGDLEAALTHWARCANEPGPHQMRIVYALAGRGIPAAAYVDVLQPDWQTLREVWARYREAGTPQDLEHLAAYAARVTERDSLTKNRLQAAHLWLFQAGIYQQLGRQQEALACLEKAYRLGPHVYPIRFALGQVLLSAAHYAEAEPHIRWCLARRPENKALSAALVEITKQRFAQRAPDRVK